MPPHALCFASTEAIANYRKVRGANKSLKRSTLHLHGLLRNPADTCV